MNMVLTETQKKIRDANIAKGIPVEADPPSFPKPIPQEGVPIVSLGVVTVTKGGGSVQKKIDLIDGRAVKDATHDLGVHSGHHNDVQVGGLVGLAALIEGLNFNQALTAGISGREGAQRLVTKKKLAKLGEKAENTIARSKDYLKWPDKLFALPIDHDAEPGVAPLSPDGLRDILVGVFPNFEAVGRLVTHSTSSHIYNANTGECLKGEGNHHTYVLARGDVDRFNRIAKDYFWLKDKGFYKSASVNAQTGVSAILERHPIDLSVGSSERIICEAGALLGEGLEQRRPEPEVYPGGVWDLDAIPELTPEEKAIADSNKQMAESGARIQQLERATEFQVKEKNLEPKPAESAANKAIQDCDRGVLLPDHILYLEDGTEIAAGDLMDKHVGLKLRDPQEPDYDGGRLVAKIFEAKQGEFRIHSFAHGEKNYTIQQQTSDWDFKTLTEAQYSDLGLSSETYSALISKCESIPAFILGISEQWVNLSIEQIDALLKRVLDLAVEHLSRTTMEALGDQLKKAGKPVGIPSTSINRMLKEAIALMERKREQQRAECGENLSDLPPRGFSSTPEGGLIFATIKHDEDGKATAEIDYIGNHLKAIAYVNSPDGDNAGLLVEFKTYRGVIDRWVMDRRSLGGDVGSVLGELYAREYRYSYPERQSLTQYLCELGNGLEESYTVTDVTGWVNDSFVLPGYTVGDESFRFQNVEPQANGPIEIKGTATSWSDTVGRKCEGNSRAIFAIGAAFAAPLQTLLDVESGGFHIVGGTSQGKTTLLTIAASTVGIKKIPSWNSTTNGLESVACAHNNLLLPLDEIGQADPREVGKAAYMLGNGQGKTRMTKALTNRKPKQWKLLTLSSGEVSIVEYLKQGGSQVKGGMEVRMLDIPAVPKGRQYGAFESIHGATTAAAFVAELERDCAQYHGAVFKEYLEHLVAARKEAEFLPTLNRRLWEIVKALIGDEKDSMIGRAAKRFALVQLALEIAHRYGLLPFPVEQCPWAISTIFRDWMDARGGAGSIEVKQACERIEELFVRNQHSDRIYDLDSPSLDSDGKPRPIRDLLAYRKLNASAQRIEYLVPAAVFQTMAIGVDKAALLAELERRGWYLGADKRDKAAQIRRGPNNTTMRVYVFCAFWQEEESISDAQNAAVAAVPDSVQTENKPQSTTPIPPPPNPPRNAPRWIPTHKMPNGNEVAIERRYGKGLAAVRDGAGKAHCVAESDLTSLEIPVEVAA
jgi:uncharacterized protein (DUF927 family)